MFCHCFRIMKKLKLNYYYIQPRVEILTIIIIYIKEDYFSRRRVLLNSLNEGMIQFFIRLLHLLRGILK